MRYGWSEVIVQQVAASSGVMGFGWSNRPAWQGLARILDVRVRVTAQPSGPDLPPPTPSFEAVRLVYAPASSGPPGLMSAAVSVDLAPATPVDPRLGLELVVKPGTMAGRILVPCSSPHVAIVAEQMVWVVADYQVFTRYRREPEG